MTFKSISDGYLMPTLIAGIANSVMLRFSLISKRIANTLVFEFKMIFKSSFAGRLIFTLIARKTNTSMVRLYMTFKSISDGYLMPRLIAGIDFVCS